eukprot:m.62348 g.62348  ORF g.62348 m.62348 type:complete len:93 (-) comp17675_c0_seq1:967-1245(-)
MHSVPPFLHTRVNLYPGVYPLLDPPQQVSKETNPVTLTTPRASVGIVTGTRRTTAGGWGMISLRNPSFQRVIPSTQMISDHTSDNCAAPISG